MPNRYERTHGYDVTRLDRKAREKVLDDWRRMQTDHDWWDFTYEDAKRMGALMGITVEDIQFTGFCSQGDGASFTGTYKGDVNGADAVCEECGGQDATLIDIAEKLTLLYATWKLEHGRIWEGSIARMSGLHSHSGMILTGYSDDEEDYAGKAARAMDIACEVQIKRFADWLYSQLEAEYDYLTSDEAVIETIRANELRFDSSGATI